MELSSVTYADNELQLFYCIYSCDIFVTAAFLIVLIVLFLILCVFLYKKFFLNVNKRLDFVH